MRFQTLEEWLSWQEGLHPSEIDLGLARIREVYQRLDSALECPVITVAGTNGKGSTVAMLESTYRAAGYRVGAYTSPHLLHYNERVRINGLPAADDLFCESFERIDQARGEISLTYFEFGTLAALDIFAASALDVVILEVGLGGRLDATNIIDADVAVITPIALDHADWLGHDRETIGREKAGIMRGGRPAICGDRNAPASVRETAERLGATLYQLGREFDHYSLDGQWGWQWNERRRDALPEPALRGAFQRDNAAAVIMAVELLQKRLPVSQGQLREGLASVSLPGRFQVIQGTVPVVLDVAHNPHAARSLAENLRSWPMPGITYGVTAVMADKDIPAVFSELSGEIDQWLLTTVALPRAATRERLTECLRSAVPDADLLAQPATVAEALSILGERVQPNDRIVVFGSFYTVADALAYNAGLSSLQPEGD